MKKRFMHINEVESSLVYEDAGSVQARERRALQLRAHTAEAFKTYLTFGSFALITLVILAAFLIAIFGNLKQYLATASAFMQIVLDYFLPGVFVSLALFLLSKAYRGWMAYKRDSLELETLRDENTRENKKADAEIEKLQAEAAETRARARQLALTLPVDERGNLVYLNPLSGELVQIIGQKHEFPLLTNYHNSPRATVSEEKRSVQEAAQIDLKVPTGRELLLNGTVTQALMEGFIILGMLENGQLARLKITRCFSTLVSGLPSVGKTTTVFWIAGQLVIIGARLWVVDPHMHFQDEDGNKSLAAELSALADSFVFPPCDGEPQQVIYRLRFMYTELRKRQKPGYIVRAKDTIIGIMDEFNSIADSIDTESTVVTHEGRDLNFAQTLALIEREGRKYGLHFMLIGHKWTRQDIGGDNAVRTNATTYLCHKLNDQRQADLLLGGGMGKKVLELTVGSYWITGPTWNAAPARITTPAISAVDLPILSEIKGRGVQVLKESNVIESTVAAPVISEDVSEAMSGDISEVSPHAPIPLPLRHHIQEPVEPVETTGDDTPLAPALEAKMHLVLDMDAQQKGQNEIIAAVWGVDPTTRQGRVAAEELRQIRAYLASINRKRLQKGAM